MAIDAKIFYCYKKFGEKVLTDALRSLQNLPRTSENYQNKEEITNILGDENFV